MPYTFNLPSFFPVQNLDEYGRALFRKGFGGFAGFGDGRRGPRQSNSLIDQLFPNDFGGPSRIPSRVPPRPPRDTRDSGSIGGGSNFGGGGSNYGGGGGSNYSGDRSGKGSITSLPKTKEFSEKAAQLIYRTRDYKYGKCVRQ